MPTEQLQGQSSRVRQPFFQVRANGVNLTGVVSVDVEATGHFAADTFKLECAISALPPNMGVEYWSDATNQDIEVDGGFSDATGTQFMSFIVGRVDDQVIDWGNRRLTLTGRDMSGMLIDTKVNASGPVVYTDQTASQVAAKIAADHGLQAQITATTDRVGKLYEQFHAHIPKDQSEWDLLVFLAQREQFELYVKGRTLYFGPPADPSSDPYILQWQDLGPGQKSGNFKDLTTRRALTLAGDIKVVVRSYHAKDQVTYTSSPVAQKIYKGTDPARQPIIYTYNVPNLDQNGVNQYAQARLNEISKHERVINASLPGDNLLDVRKLVRLTGTQTSFDQVYFPDVVSRHMSFDKGYRMELRAKNTSPHNVTVNA